MTRRSGDLPKEGDKRLTENFHAVIKPHHILERGAGLEDGHGLGLEECGARLGLGLVNAKITELFSEAYNWDPFPMKVLAMLEKKVCYCKDITLAECSRSPTGRLLYRGKFYVPAYGPLRLYLIQTHHEVPVAGHPGQSKTLELLSRTTTGRKYGKMWKGL